MHNRFSKSRSYQQIVTSPVTRYPNCQRNSSPERQTPNSRVSGISDFQSTIQHAHDDDTTTPSRGINRDSIPLYATQSTRMIHQAMAPCSPGSSTSDGAAGEKQTLNERMNCDDDNVIHELKSENTSSSSPSPPSEHPQHIFRERNSGFSKKQPSPSSIQDKNKGYKPSKLKTSSSTAATTTKLHRLCRAMITFGDILLAKSILSSEDAYNNKNSASIKDESGATPLHVIAWNIALAEKVCGQSGEAKGFSKLYPQSSFDTLEAESTLKKEVVKFLVHDLLTANPKAMVQVDNEGFIPFQAGLARWVHTCQNSVLNAATRKNGRNSSAMGQVWESTSLTLNNAMKLAKGKAVSMSQKRLSVGDGDLEQRLHAEFHPEVNAFENCENTDAETFVVLSEHARFILIMLSAIIHRLEMNGTSREISSPRFGDNANNSGFERARIGRGGKRIEGAREIATTIIEEGKQD